MARLVSIENVWILVIADQTPNALWKAIGQSVFVLRVLLVTRSSPVNQLDARMIMNVEMARHVSVENVLILVWCKILVVDLLNATQPDIKLIASVSQVMKVIHSLPVKLLDVAKTPNVPKIGPAETKTV